MRLLRLHVENFGTLQDLHMDFSAGLNVLHRENGWGKSTLAAFIKAMFYGLPASTKRSLEENERKKYTPWQGGGFGGSLEFSTEKGRFRIERFFGAKESADTVCLYDLATNRISDLYGERIGEAVFGIDAEGFERTVYLSQRQTAPKGENNSITAKLGNLLDDVDDIGSFDDAMAILEKRRRFYTMTGNRGHVADLEEECGERQAELERLLRAREVMEAREAEEEDCNEQIRLLRGHLREIRTKLQRAGELREQRLLREQKRQMVEEIDVLKGKKAESEARLGGEHPTGEELEAQRQLLMRAHEARVNLDALPRVPSPPEALELLPFGVSSRIAEEELLSKLTIENNKLQNLSHREESIHELQRESTHSRFPNGIPTQAQIDTLFSSLKKADELKREAAERAQAQAPKKSRFGIPTWLFLLAGCVLSFLSFLGGFEGLQLYFLIASGASLALCALFGMLWIRSSARIRKSKEAHLSRLQEIQRAREERLQSVERALRGLGFSSHGGDLIRAVTELSVLAGQAREQAQRAKGAKAELAALETQKAEVLGRMQTAFRSFGIALPAKTDYRDEIECLRRDTARIKRARQEEQMRLAQRAKAEENWNTLQRRLLPFQKRFDKEMRMTPQACLQWVSEEEAEFLRLQESLATKEAALQRFLREKSIPASAEAENALDEDDLIERENTLHTQLQQLQDRAAALHQQIERMAQQTDTIPEQRALLEQTEAALREAKANSTTIAHTEKLLEEAKVALSTRYLGDMQKSFERFLSVITADSVTESVMDPSFEVSLRKGGKTRSMESFSKGWRDAVQFCIRLSLTDALYRDGEKPFLLLDDPFANLDDARLAAAKQLIHTLSHTYQIIYTVCHAERT